MPKRKGKDSSGGGGKRHDKRAMLTMDGLDIKFDINAEDEQVLTAIAEQAGVDTLQTGVSFTFTDLRKSNYLAVF